MSREKRMPAEPDERMVTTLETIALAYGSGTAEAEALNERDGQGMEGAICWRDVARRQSAEARAVLRDLGRDPWNR